jgi:hypothetical protein
MLFSTENIIAQEESGVFTTSDQYNGNNSEQLDAQSNFFVNPNPHQANISGDAIPLEEIFGLNQNTFGPVGPRSRGNLFTCTTARKIIEHRMYLNPSVATQMWFCIYEGSAQVGIYNLVDSVNVSPQGPGEGWYSSGPIDFDMTPGMYYLIFASFEQPSNYWTENPVAPYPFPASFGELTAGAGWNYAPTSNFPPDATQDVPATAFGEPVAYYQTIVTDDILTAPTAPSNLVATPVSANSIEVTWTDNSDNEEGFLIQRKLTVGGTWADLTTVGADETSFVDGSLVTGNEYCYRIRAFNAAGNSAYTAEDCAIPTGIEEITSGIPSEFSLFNNYPNPFNPATTIYYAVPEISYVKIKVYDALGSEVATLLADTKVAGYHSVQFDATNLQSGIYFYQLQAGNFTSTKKMILMK